MGMDDRNIIPDISNKVREIRNTQREYDDNGIAVYIDQKDRVYLRFKTERGNVATIPIDNLAISDTLYTSPNPYHSYHVAKSILAEWRSERIRGARKTEVADVDRYRWWG